MKVRRPGFEKRAAWPGGACSHPGSRTAPPPIPPPDTKATTASVVSSNGTFLGETERKPTSYAVGDGDGWRRWSSSSLVHWAEGAMEVREPPPLLATVMSVSVSASVVVIVGSLPPQPPPIRDGSATAIATPPQPRGARGRTRRRMSPRPHAKPYRRPWVGPAEKKNLKNIKSERLRGDSGGVLRQRRGRMMRRRRRAAAACGGGDIRRRRRSE
jgi:hypothetical protein